MLPKGKKDMHYFKETVFRVSRKTLVEARREADKSGNGKGGRSRFGPMGKLVKELEEHLAGLRKAFERTTTVGARQSTMTTNDKLLADCRLLDGRGLINQAIDLLSDAIAGKIQKVPPIYFYWQTRVAAGDCRRCEACAKMQMLSASADACVGSVEERRHLQLTLQLPTACEEVESTDTQLIRL